MPWRNLIHILLSERSQAETAVFYMILTILWSGKGKTVETIKRSGAWREGGMNRQNTENFKGSKTFCMILRWWIHALITSVKIRRLFHTQL